MRLCRYLEGDTIHVGCYLDDAIVPMDTAVRLYWEKTQWAVRIADSNNLLDYLPPDGKNFKVAHEIGTWIEQNRDACAEIARTSSEVKILSPADEPKKILLLAGNYADHVEEGGGMAVDRKHTFPHVFMKPPSTTLNHPGANIQIPAISPNHIDWEIELGVIIGRRARRVTESDALNFVAGYTIVNDISDRRFCPNPGRETTDRDVFFDWLHGKWHDGFCPVGPCVRSAESLTNPQNLGLQLTVNGEIKQNSNTSQQIFSVAAVISFISQFVTLEPGDLISTGTPSGVGATTNSFLQPGDHLAATIEGIGVLKNQMVASAEDDTPVFEI